MPKLELVGITGRGESARAMVQDIEADELRTVRAGETFGATTVVSIDAGRVTLRAHGRSFTLSLDGGAP